MTCAEGVRFADSPQNRDAAAVRERAAVTPGEPSIAARLDPARRGRAVRFAVRHQSAEHQIGDQARQRKEAGGNRRRAKPRMAVRSP